MRADEGFDLKALVGALSNFSAALRGGTNRNGRREGGAKGKGYGKGGKNEGGSQCSRGLQWTCHRNCRDFHGKPLENNIGREVCRRCGVARPKEHAPAGKSPTTSGQRGSTARTGPVGAGGSVPLVARRAGTSFRDVVAVKTVELQPTGLTSVGRGARPQLRPDTDVLAGGGAGSQGSGTGVTEVQAATAAKAATAAPEPAASSAAALASESGTTIPEAIRIDENDDDEEEDQVLEKKSGEEKAKADLDARTDIFNKLKKACGRKDAATEMAWKEMEAARAHYAALKAPPPEWIQIGRIDKKLQHLVEKQERRNAKWDELEKNFQEETEKLRQEEQTDLERAAELQRERKEVASSLAPKAEQQERRRATREKLAAMEEQLESIRLLATGNDVVEQKLKVVQQAMAELGAGHEHASSEEVTGGKEKGGGEAGEETMDVGAWETNQLAEGEQLKERKRMRPSEADKRGTEDKLTFDQMRAKVLDKIKARILAEQQKELASKQPEGYAANAAGKSPEELAANTALIEKMFKEVEERAEKELREMSAAQQQALLIGSTEGDA